MDPFHTSSTAHPSHAAIDEINDNPDTITGNPNYETQPPEHHVHGSNEPLPQPGGRGRRRSIDYSPSNINNIIDESVQSSADARAGESGSEERVGHGHGHGACTHPLHHAQENIALSGHHGVCAHNTQHTHHGSNVGCSESSGHGIRADEETTKPGFGDKVVGKTQKFMGQVTNSTDLKEKGELRETFGKSTVTDEFPRVRD